jgi:ATP/ADP translocase
MIQQCLVVDSKQNNLFFFLSEHPVVSLVLVAHILLLVVMKRRPINKNMSALNTLAADGKQGNWQLFPYVVILQEWEYRGRLSARGPT